MSKTPGIGSSHEDHPTSEYTFPAGLSASPYGAVVQETVLNPEGRRLAGLESSSYVSGHSGTDDPAIDSRIWKRLFPIEADPSGIADFDAPAGCELGHFAIEERIGSGGMGAVFRALDQRLQRVVALKVLSPGQSRDRASVMRFQNEARSAARLDHENVARVHYVGEDRGLHFIAFEYVTGQNVRDLIGRTGRLSVIDAVNYTLQIAAALRHTAAAGVVHRDIKPSNIIIAPNGRAKLVDLGLARKLTADGAGDLTVAGTTLGTFDYISPEQARDPRNVDVRSDIYSLGCTLYHMLTGGPPYSRGTVLQKLLDHQSGQAPDPRAVNPQVPPALSALCRKMMAGDPKNRPLTPDELIRELAVIAGGLGLRPMPAEGYVWSRPATAATPKIRSGLIWAGSAAVVLVLALLVDRPISVDQPLESQIAVDQASNAAFDEQQASSVANSTREAMADAPRTMLSPPPVQYEPSEAASDREDRLANATTSQWPAAKAGVTRPGSSSPAIGSVSQADPATSKPPVETASTFPSTATRDEVLASSDRSAPWVIAAFDWLRSSADALSKVAPSVDRSTVHDANPASAPPASSSDAASDPLPYGRPAKPFVMRPFNGDGEFGEYSSLAEAVVAASSGSTIELHYDGRDPNLKPAEPLLIEGKSLTIKAGFDEKEQRLYRPVVEFIADPSTTKRSQMIRVSGQGGDLSIDRVELTMSVKGEALTFSRQWSLFSLSETQHVRLTDVGITVTNPKAWPGVSVFDLRQPENRTAQANRMDGLMDEGRSDGFAVELDDCLVRGGTDFMTVAHTRRGRVSLRDSAFALQSASLLNVTGGIEQPLAGDALKVELSHVTVVVGDALVRLDVGTLPNYAATIQATVRDSVFATSTAGPLVLMTGNLAPPAFLEMLEWDGNNNVFDGFSEYWSILTEDGASDLAPHRFQMWKDHWTRLSSDFGDSIAEQAISPFEFTNIWMKSWEAKNSNKSDIEADDLELDPGASNVDLKATDSLEREANELSGLVGAAVDELPRVTSASISLTSAKPSISPR